MMEKLGLLFCALCALSLSQTSAQYYPVPYPGQPQQYHPYSGAQPWPPAYRSNFTNTNPLPNPTPNPYYYPDPNAQAYPNPQAYPDPLTAENINRLYGAPPPPQTSGYPQIYKIDNLIIIANPTPQQPQPCIPQTRPPTRPPTNPPTEEDVLNRDKNGEPSACTWAIVACCSPNNVQVRYSCFELLGCPGFFFDDSACTPKLVMAAANAALEFYGSSRNTTSSSTQTDTNSNRL